ncbi:hypothetical protein D3869_16530 (plasmid) [Azospirillum brasilense]|uniref:DUF3618 domain-containing protein n=1 Tax=Azospirillum brasilense TaxID=192 RepID=A0A4D8R5P1_AZOBR|nr:hypothetical protein [Azospirillum brasilense]QCO16904.1 hypothetical protein D3869_16530 [Azospirillum brasilense]
MNRATDPYADTKSGVATGNTASTAPTSETLADTPALPPGRRGKDEIEQDIHAIRGRMDAVLDEIEFRLSPGQMSGGVIEVVRDVVEGNPSRVARAIRSNPWPLALVAAGALWFAWTVSRTPEVEPAVPGAAAGQAADGTTQDVLSVLVAACRQGAVGFRQAEMVLHDPDLTARLTQVASQFDRSAAALEAELVRRGGGRDLRAPVHAVWRELDTELGGARTRGGLLRGLESGVEGTLGLFRNSLHEELPEELTVIVGAHFHEIETVRHRVGALREAVA